MSSILRKKCDQQPRKEKSELYGRLNDISDKPERNEEAESFAQLAMEEEQERLYNERTGDVESWTDISDSWVRSENDGWYYDDED